MIPIQLLLVAAVIALLSLMSPWSVAYATATQGNIILDVRTLECNNQGRQQSAPTLSLPATPNVNDANNHRTHTIMLTGQQECLCARAYRFLITPTRLFAAPTVPVRVCFNEVRLVGKRVVLKKKHAVTGRRSNLAVFEDDGLHSRGRATITTYDPQCNKFTLDAAEMLELRLKVYARCEQHSRLNITFTIATEEEVPCRKPQQFRNGDIYPANKTDFRRGEIIYYECHEDYAMVDSRQDRSVCGDNGTWLRPAPRCVHKDEWCPMVNLTIPNGRVLVPEVRSVGAALRVRCNDSYYLHGLPDYECKQNGQWESHERMSRVTCSRTPNCPVAGGEGVGFVSPIRPGQFSRQCCRHGYIRSNCGAGRRCSVQCTESLLCRRTGRWLGTPIQCQPVEPLWTRLYNSLFNEAEAMNQSIVETPHRCSRQAEEENDNGEAPTSRTVQCSRSITDLRGCFDLAFLIDASYSIDNDTLHDVFIPFVRVVTSYFVISPERTRVSVQLFQESSSFILQQEGNASVVYEVLSNVTRGPAGNTNLRLGFQQLTEHVALNNYNGTLQNRTQCKKVVFALSDGEINVGGRPAQVADTLKTLGWMVYAIGVGEDSRAMQSFKSIASQPAYEYQFTLAKPRPPGQRRGGASGRQGLKVEEIISRVIPSKGKYDACGRSDVPLIQGSRARILNGQTARHGAYPWQVALVDRRTRKIFCSGTLICNGSCKRVLTAAHCLQSRRRAADILLWFGENDITVQEGSEIECGVERITMGPGREHDIAILVPNHDCQFPLSTRRRCLCLPEESDKPFMEAGQLAEISGWGAQEATGAVQSSSHVLRWAQMRVVGLDTCEKNKALTNRSLCSEGVAVGADSCHGDSGGMLVARRSDDSYVALGILSYAQVQEDSAYVCGQQGYYAVYTRVLAYQDWIQSQMRLCISEDEER